MDVLSFALAPADTGVGLLPSLLIPLHKSKVWYLGLVQFGSSWSGFYANDKALQPLATCGYLN